MKVLLNRSRESPFRFDFFAPDTEDGIQEVLSYSLKNIPLPSHYSYAKCLTSRTENFLVMCRWKLWHYKNPGLTRNIETLEFKSPKYPNKDANLKGFEDDMIELIRNVEMRSYNNSLQKKMNEDKKRIRESDKILISADET